MLTESFSRTGGAEPLSRLLSRRWSLMAAASFAVGTVPSSRSTENILAELDRPQGGGCLASIQLSLREPIHQYTSDDDKSMFRASISLDKATGLLPVGKALTSFVFT